MELVYNSEKHKRLCLHEAGHFVFSLLLKRIWDYKEVPCEITVDEEKGWYRVHLIPGKANNPRSYYEKHNELIKVRSDHAIADIILNLSGSATHIAYLGGEDPYYLISQLNQSNESLIRVDDFYNARLIGYEFFRDMDNECFYLFAKTIQSIIVEIMNHDLIKFAIYKVAETIAIQKTIMFSEMNEFESKIENLINKYDITIPFGDIFNKYKMYHPISIIQRGL